MKYIIRLISQGETILEREVFLEYVPECFIYNDEVYIVDESFSCGRIQAYLSTPSAIWLD